MPTIEGNYYRLTPINEHSPKYDLELLHDIGGKNPRQEFKVVAYGVPLERALESTILFATNKKLGEEVVSLKEFLNVYKEESSKIRRELEQIMS